MSVLCMIYRLLSLINISGFLKFIFKHLCWYHHRAGCNQDLTKKTTVWDKLRKYDISTITFTGTGNHLFRTSFCPEFIRQLEFIIKSSNCQLFLTVDDELYETIYKRILNSRRLFWWSMIRNLTPATKFEKMGPIFENICFLKIADRKTKMKFSSRCFGLENNNAVSEKQSLLMISKWNFTE